VADAFGRRRLFLAGLSVFTLASLAAGLAGSRGVLIGARVVQGRAPRSWMAPTPAWPARSRSSWPDHRAGRTGGGAGRGTAERAGWL